MPLPDPMTDEQLDFETGDPKQAAGELAENVAKFNQLLGALGPLAEAAIAGIGNGGTGVTSLAELRALIGAFDVGDYKVSARAAPTAGWLLCNGTTIGSLNSNAASKSDAYEQLFLTLWTAQPDLPVLPNRGASAAADWAANKEITLPDGRGRFIVGAGLGPGLTNRPLGSTGGFEDAIVVDHTHGAGGLATTSAGNHTHGNGAFDDPGLNQHAGSTGGSALRAAQTGPAGAHVHGITGQTAPAGESGADRNVPPYMAGNLFIYYGL